MIERIYTLITGASEGFGKAIAIECACRKMNLILVALPGIELDNLVDFIKVRYSVSVIGIGKDLCKEDSPIEVFNEVKALGLRVNMLINNAGVGSTGLFEEGGVDLYERQIKLNVLATTLITRLFLDMLKQNKSSYILNVGSLASFFPLPKKQVYGATKSFIYYFSKCLQKELKKDNVFVSILCPGAMMTNSTVQLVIQKGNYLIRNSCIHPEKVAAIVINGMLKRKGVMIPGILNKCYVILLSVLPEFIKAIITNHSMRKLNSLRESNPFEKTYRNLPLSHQGYGA